MSRTADRVTAARRRLRGDDGGEAGFTLVEILVSLTLFSVIAAAAAGMLVTGLRTSLVSKLDTGAKNLGQERVEIMRNLPFHIPRDPAATTPDSHDLLDIYFRNLTAAPNDKATGFVGACGTETTVCAGRASWDPKSGSFYRYVIDPVPGHPKYRQYVSTQFLNENRVPLAPASTYDSQVSGADSGPSQFVGVTVTTFWTAGKLSKSFTLETLISAGRPAASRVTLQARGAALKLTGNVDAARLLTLETAVVNLDGALAVGASSAAQAAGARASITNSGSFDASLDSLQSPPNPAPVNKSESAKSLVDSSVTVAHVGNTEIRDLAPTVTGGLPAVGSQATPVIARVQPHGAGAVPLRFSPLPAPNSHLMIDTTRPLVWSDPGSNVAVAESRGYLTSTAGVSHAATASVTGSTLTVAMFPTTFAPSGVVQLSLNAAALTCTTNGTTGSATLTYGATLSYWNGTGYTTLALDHGQGTSPLDSVNLPATQVGVDSFGTPIYLSEYVSSWSSATTATIAGGRTVDTDSNRVEAAYEGLVKITSAPMRDGDASSTVGLLAGNLTCIAEDNR